MQSIHSIDNSDPAAAPADKSGIALLAAACVVFVLAYFAMLAGVADDTINNFVLFAIDAPRIWLVFERWLTDRQSFWDAQWSSSNFILDIAIIYPLYWLLGYVGGGLVYPFVAVALSAAGWVVLCAAALGKNHSRAAFVVAAHALPFVYMAWFGDNIFLIILLPVYHFTAWVAIPWSLYLAVRILQGGGRSFIFGFAALVALSVLSDPVSIPWFCAPFAAALFLMFYADNKANRKKTREQRQTISRYKTALMALLAGVVIGYLASKQVPLTGRIGAGFISNVPNLNEIITSFTNLTDWFLLYAKESVTGALIWLAFIIVAGRKFTASLPFAPRALEISIERRLLFLFVPLSMAASAAAAILTGLVVFADLESFLQAGGFGGKRYISSMLAENTISVSIRYFIPLLFLPLYVAWAIYLPALRARIMGAALLTVAALALPRAAALDWQNLDPYAHPFYACLHEAAERLDAKAGIISSFWGNEMFAYPHWQWQEYINVGAARGKEGFLYVDKLPHVRIEKASFDFVVANASEGEVSLGIPGRQPFICDYDQWHQCVRRVHPAIVLDGQAIRGAFGEPQEVIQCPGNAAVHYYNPPIVVEDIHNHKQIGNPFNAQPWQHPTDK